ncbi:dynamin family protein [Candidatus Pristimantibacillus sp. PTI5]|uniref:dynamin family protein n=1 Tax=Candidatus Pristimantibacillus sp. PTI5 TaxID=3400422 RepID=UPI003B01CDCB
MESAVSNKFEAELLQLIESFQSLDLSATSAEGYYRKTAEALAKQVREKEFRVTVVGEFSAGKSTFLNALIGKDILPHALTETTATVTYIRNVSPTHPDVDTIKVHFNDSQREPVIFNMKTDPEALKTYTTTQSQIRVAQEIKYVEVFVNFRHTNEPIVFIDTPGLNGVADGHRDLTMHEIKQAHASICLFHLRSLAHSNLEFLKILHKHQRSFLFVLNFIDEIKTSEGDSVELKIATLREQYLNQIEEQQDIATSTRFFGVSALKALAGKDTSIPRLYNGDLKDLTLEERSILLSESLFPKFEDSLWYDVLSGEKNQVFQTSIYLSFNTLLKEIIEELRSAKQFSQVKLDEKETDEITKRLAQLEGLTKRNWEKLSHYMTSRQADLDKIVRAKLDEDLENIMNQLGVNMRQDDFEAFELAMKQNSYSKQLQNKTSMLSHEYQLYLTSILEEIYQTSIMRVQEYSPTVSIETSHKGLRIKAVNFDGNDYKFEKQLSTLQEKKIDLKVQRGEIVDLQLSISQELQYMETKAKQLNEGILKSNEQQLIEQRRLGSEPSVRTRTETRYRTVERSKINPLRWIGNKTYEESYNVDVPDTTDRDQWRKQKDQIQLKYAKHKDDLQKESTQLQIRKKQFATKASQHTDMLQAIDHKLSQIEHDLRRKQIEYEEVLMKAKNEFIRSEKRRLLEQINQFVQDKVKPGLIESIKLNIDENMSDVRQQVQTYYEKHQSEVKRRLTIMLEESKESLQQQVAPFETLQITIVTLREQLEQKYNNRLVT